MRSRPELVQELIRNPNPDPGVVAELAAFGWDCDAPLGFIGPSDVMRVLELFERGEISAQRVEDWADSLEYREDIGYEKEILGEVVFWLANPAINFPIDHSLVLRIRRAIEQNTAE